MVKTDRRDARMLADALKVEVYRPAHRSTDLHRHARAELAVRDSLVHTHTSYVGLLKALVRLASGTPEHTGPKVAAPRWLEYYNRERPHTALGYRPPQHRLLALVNNVLVNHS